MAKRRFQYIPEAMWPYLGPAFKGINEDLNSLEASGGGTGSGVTSWNDLNDKPLLSKVATTGAYADLTGRPTIPDVSGLAPKANPTFTGTVSGITKAMVGLGNVDNVSDAMKSFAGTQITSGQINPARLGTGSPDGTKFLAGDGLWKTPPSGGGAPAPANASLNLSGQHLYSPVTYFWADYGNGDTSLWNKTLRYRPHLVIINPSSGFGAGTSAVFVEQTKRAKAVGAKTVGYVLTGWASRPVADVKAEVDKYVTSYGVDGVFLDEAINGWGDQAGKQAYYTDLVNYFHTTYGQQFIVVANPGTNTIDEMLPGGDVLMTFEGPASTYLSTAAVVSPSAAYLAAPSYKFWHVVHDVTSVDLAVKVLERFDQAHAAHLYLTDDHFDPATNTGNPYDSVPSDWLQALQQAYINGGMELVRATAASLSAGSASDMTVVQRSDGSWPPVTRSSGAHYRWLIAYDETNPPTAANGVATGDELVTASTTKVVTA